MEREIVLLGFITFLIQSTNSTYFLDINSRIFSKTMYWESNLKKKVYTLYNIIIVQQSAIGNFVLIVIVDVICVLKTY